MKARGYRRVECWMCGLSSTELEMNEDSTRFVLPMVNCEDCGCLLDEEWLRICAMRHANRLPGNSDIRRREILLASEKQHTSRSTTRPVAHRLLGILMACLVMAQSTLVYLGNAFVLIPEILFELYPSHPWLYASLTLQHILVLGMYGAIIALYWRVIWHHPGRIPTIASDSTTTTTADLPQGKTSHMRKYKYMGYSWCRRCDFVKPPDAHHCRRCGTCIYNLDHHCIYTANTCIGQDNIAQFLSFLRHLTIGSCVSSLISIAYAWVFRARLLRACSLSRRFAHNHEASFLGVFRHIHFLYLFAYDWTAHPLTLTNLVWLESFVVSIAACIGSCMLLYRQMRLQCAGMTYLARHGMPADQRDTRRHRLKDA